MSVKKLSDFRAKIYEMEKQYAPLAAEIMPVGSQIIFDKGGHQQSGIIILPGGLRGALVRNIKTGKEYWVDHYFITGIQKP